MTCPKCEEGRITTIILKKNAQKARLCDSCGTVWLEDESIHESTGTKIESLTKDGGMEYTFVDATDENQESKSVMYPKYK